MADQRNLFDVDTRRYAYESLDVSDGERLVLQTLRDVGELTADEIAHHTGKSVLFVRPRVSALKKFRLIEDTGERRRNESGRPAAVWRLVRDK